MQLLLVEDKTRLADALKTVFARQGWSTDIAGDGPTGLDYALLGNYDVIILDIMLPGFDGFELLRRYRKEQRATPVLLLTARDDVRDKISGLDLGADDYLTKPFEAGELLARIRALTRRSGEVVLDTLQVGKTVLDLHSGELSYGGEGTQTSVRLTFKELELCRLLMSNIGQIFPKIQLMEKFWGLDASNEENSVEAYISFLRKKLDYLHSDLQISTIRKLGYRMEQADEHPIGEH